MANRTMNRVVPFPSHLPRRDRRDTLAISYGKQNLFQGAEIFPPSSLLKNRVTLTKGGDAGDRVISEAARTDLDYLGAGPRLSRGDHLHDPTLFPEGLQELLHGLPQHRMAEARRNLVEGLEREAPLVQPRMGHSELD